MEVFFKKEQKELTFADVSVGGRFRVRWAENVYMRIHEQSHVNVVCIEGINIGCLSKIYNTAIIDLVGGNEDPPLHVDDIQSGTFFIDDDGDLCLKDDDKGFTVLWSPDGNPIGFRTIAAMYTSGHWNNMMGTPVIIEKIEVMK